MRYNWHIHDKISPLPSHFMMKNVIYPVTKYHGVTRCPNKIDLTLLIDLPWKTSIVRCHYRQSVPERENHTNSCQHPALIRTADRSTKKPQTRSSSAPTPLKRYGVVWFFFETVRIMGKNREKPRDLWCIHTAVGCLIESVSLRASAFRWLFIRDALGSRWLVEQDCAVNEPAYVQREKL